MSNSMNIRAIMESIEQAQIVEGRALGAAMLANIIFDSLQDSDSMGEDDGPLGMGAGGDENLAALKVAFAGQKYTVQITKV